MLIHRNSKWDLLRNQETIESPKPDKEKFETGSSKDNFTNNKNELGLTVVDTDNEFLDIDNEIAKEILADIDKEEAEMIARVRLFYIY